ncbi:cation:proton antiporter subunit C [Granulosicoccus sp. 3-233]|uniref:cation:proton antiporter subunit C n=1 Tax=Granulosicoccus sp. 3-233 TaxID=3417969 RepID=UPI003D33CD94
MSQLIGLYSYWVVIVLMMAGLYIMIARYNLVKKIIGLSLFQTSIFYLYITMSKIEGGTAPILVEDADYVYSNPLPHVLILTAIVVGVATSAVALALIVRIYESYGTIEEDELKSIEAAEPDA